MKVLIDGQTLSTPDRDRGIGLALRRICEHLLLGDTATQWFIAVHSTAALSIFAPPVRERLHAIEVPSASETQPYDERTKSYSAALQRVVAELGISAYWNANPLMLNTVLPTDLAGVSVFATIYDVIPAVMPELYLDRWPNALQREYRRRLAALPAWAECLVCASANTQRDFVRIDSRVAEKSRVVHLGVDHARFWPHAAPADPNRDPYVLFAGGFDPRKNMQKALQAFAHLVQQDPAAYSRLKFCVVCAAPENDAGAYRRAAAELGVADRLILTGYVSESSLADLYRSASVFFFPSRYEGFGLPVLEAMACGVPVVAAATASLAEVAGACASYCSAEDTADMARALAAVLRDGAGDGTARRLAVDHARQFAWSKTAATYSRLFTHRRPASVTMMRRRARVAYVSPWPPQRSGVAAYGRELLVYLRQHLDLSVYVDGPARAACDGEVPLKDLAGLKREAGDYDVIMYQIGNNTTYHRGIYEAAWKYPGVAILHEVNIHPFMADAFLHSSDERLYEAALTEGYGHEGAEHYRAVRATGMYDIWRFPLSHALARRSRATVVHNRWAQNQLAGVNNVFVVPPGPIPRVTESGAAPCGVVQRQLRERLGIPSGDFVIAALGYIQRFKRIPQVVAALKHLLERGYPVHLVLGGELIDATMDLGSLLEDLDVADHVTMTGYLSDHDFDALVDLSDVVVNLRYPSLGEVSAPLLKAFAAGKACIVSNHGPSAEYPPSICWNVDPDELEVPLLVAYLEELLRNPGVRRQLGRNAAFFVEHYSSLPRAAELYAGVVTDVLGWR